MRQNFALMAIPCLLALVTATQAGDDQKKAQAQVEDYINKLVQNKFARKRITPIADESLAKVAAGSHWFGVLFPQFPVGMEPPAPLKVANVVVVDKDGKVHAFADVPALEKYAKANFPAAKGDKDAIMAMRAWLKLSEHMHDDGFYKFDLGADFPVEVKEKTPIAVKGVTKVKPEGGNKGQIEATITFAPDGKLASVKENVKLIEGIRPICQATKLLDPDPIVRRMAERDLLVLGRMGEEYLQMQRAKANPELRREIDRIWRQIIEEGR